MRFSLLLKKCIKSRPSRLIDLTIPLVHAFADYLGIHTKITYASDIFKTENDKNKRVVELCKSRDVNLFYSGSASKRYMDLNYFDKQGISVAFQDYKHPEYKQCFDGFESYMSVIDLLMNYGKNSREILLSSPLPDPLHTLIR